MEKWWHENWEEAKEISDQFNALQHALTLPCIMKLTERY
jgi:hypothetical protein